MSETLEELISIRDGAEKGSKFINSNGCYIDGGYYYDGFSWQDRGDFITMRSLEDINRIIGLMEDNNKLRQTTIKEVLNKKVSMTSTGREVWIRVQDVEDMLDE